MKCHSLCLFSLVIYRKVKDMDSQLSLMHQKLEVTKAQCDKKEAECVEKDSQVLSCPERCYFPFVKVEGDLFGVTYTTEFVLHSLPYQIHQVSLSSWILAMQINVLKTQISQVPYSAGKHGLENHQKIKGLEVFVEQMNTSKSLARTASMGHHVDYSNADFAAKRRIEELEALAEKRLREVRPMPFSCMFFSLVNCTLPACSINDDTIANYWRGWYWMQVYALNMKLAETESIMHDVIREIAGEKLDIENYKVVLLIDFLPGFRVFRIISNKWRSDLDFMQCRP